MTLHPLRFEITLSSIVIYSENGNGVAGKYDKLTDSSLLRFRYNSSLGVLFTCDRNACQDIFKPLQSVRMSEFSRKRSTLGDYTMDTRKTRRILASHI